MLGEVITIQRRGRLLSPHSPAPSSRIGRIQMRADLFWSAQGERVRDLPARAVALLAKGKLFRRAAHWVLRRWVSFSVGIPGPIRIIRAYEFVHLGTFPFTAGMQQQLPEICGQGHDLIVLARLGETPLGTMSVATGQTQIRRVARGLGLEERLLEIAAQLQKRNRFSQDANVGSRVVSRTSRVADQPPSTKVHARTS